MTKMGQHSGWGGQQTLLMNVRLNVFTTCQKRKVSIHLWKVFEVLARVRIVRFLLKFPLDYQQTEEAIVKLAQISK